MTARLTRIDGALHWYDDDAQPDLRLTATCPRCGADTEHLTAGKGYHWHAVAAIRCTDCRWHGAVTVDLVEMRDTSRADAGRLTRQDPYEAMAERRRKSRQKVSA